MFWTPAFAGVTPQGTFYEIIRFTIFAKPNRIAFGIFRSPTTTFSVGRKGQPYIWGIFILF
jgi:hypothetical protein